MAQEAVLTVLERGTDAVVDEARFLSDIAGKVESAKRQLTRMLCFLKDVDDRRLRGGAMARNLVSEVRQVAYEVEDIIDTARILTRQSDPKNSITGAICKYACFPVYLTHRHKLGSRIDSATAMINTILEEFQRLNIAATAIADEARGYIAEDDALRARRSVHPDFDEQLDVIGFDAQIEQIRDDLLDEGNRDLTVLSIVGPGGAGKSTLAKKVYGLTARRHFSAGVWATASQRFVPRDLLKEMVKGTMGGVKEAEGLEKKNDDEMKKLLHDHLSSRRYLIVVLDDIWSNDAWDIIRAAFPDKKNGSRIILTTRNEAVAKHPNARKKIYMPKLLDDKESTELLLRTAFPAYKAVGSRSRDATPQNLNEMKQLGKDLAVKCAGLPLAIVALGGYLSRNLDVAEWKRLAGSVNWGGMTGDEKGIGGILDLSYYDMPSHLRSCFMYITAFPEDYRIDVRALARLWVAEGFIPLVRGHTREEVAVKYVDELAQRCMIQVVKRGSPSGRITVIKVHDVLRDWGIERARREGLMKDCHTLEDVEAAYSEETVEAYRVVLHGFLSSEVGVSMRKLRTLLAFKFDTMEEAKSFQGLHLLRVLYLHSSALEVHLPKGIGRMRYLRYLGFGGTCTYHLPSSIGNLLSLETMDATGGRIDHIPGSLWKIRALRHVHVSRARGWSVPQITSHSKLHATVLGYRDLDCCCGCCTCACIRQGDEEEARRLKQRMEGTKRQVSKKKNTNLSCCFGMMYKVERNYQMDIVGSCRQGLRFPNDHLHLPELETPTHSIVVLKICCANLLSDDQKILELGRMGSLKMLEIGERAYAGTAMTCSAGSFPCLEWLVIYDLPVGVWNMEHGSMRSLRKLTLCKCPNLCSLPEGLSRLQQLTKLDLIAMPPDCYQDGKVAQAMEKKGCKVFISSNEEDFRHLDVPVFDIDQQLSRE